MERSYSRRETSCAPSYARRLSFSRKTSRVQDSRIWVSIRTCQVLRHGLGPPQLSHCAEGVVLLDVIPPFALCPNSRPIRSRRSMRCRRDATASAPRVALTRARQRRQQRVDSRGRAQRQIERAAKSAASLSQDRAKSSASKRWIGSSTRWPAGNTEPVSSSWIRTR